MAPEWHTKRFIDRRGRTCTLTTWSTSSSTTDSYGDYSWSSSTQTVKAFRKVRQTPQIVVDASGEERQSLNDFYIKGSVSIAAAPEQSSTIALSSVTYEIADVDVQNNDVTRLTVIRMRP